MPPTAPEPAMWLPASGLVTAGFVILPLLVAAAFVMAAAWAGRRVGEPAAVWRRRSVRLAAAMLAWLLVTGLVAASGVLRRFDVTPPPFLLLLIAIAILGIAIPGSSLGALLIRGVPLWAIVGSQVFRFPLELVMHQAYVEGVMPRQMSYSGQNYDIVSGITAGALGLWLGRRDVPRWIVAAWNVLGLVLLVNIVTIAIASTPVFGWFGKERVNIFVTYPPFVWLPAILVTAALMGHILVWRRLSEKPAAEGRPTFGLQPTAPGPS